MIELYKGLPLISMDIENEMQGVDIISLVDLPAIQEDFLKFSKEEEIKFKADNSKHIVSGPALIPDKPIFRRGEDGHDYYITFSKEAIERIAQKFFADSNTNGVNLMHEVGVDGCFYFESYLKDSKRGVAPKEYDELPDGTWFVSAKINNEDVWKLVENGTLRGFSIEGMLAGTPKEQEIDTVEDLIKYLNN